MTKSRKAQIEMASRSSSGLPRTIRRAELRAIVPLDVLEERAKIGEQRELAGEKQRHSGHALPRLRTPQQAQRAGPAKIRVLLN